MKLYFSKGDIDQYICLSHCWGTRPLLCTLSSNIDSYRSQIPWNDLPLTYQETIIFVRKLSIRYLWIDSLCIIQDDEDDWRQESAKMASIYQGSYLTISATKSADANGGIFSSAAPKFKPYKIPYNDDVSQPQEEVYARLRLLHVEIRRFSYSTSSTSQLPLFTRGWVLQERLLSPRVLHFAPEELSWECQESTACECSGLVTENSPTPNYCSQLKLYHSYAAWALLDERQLRERWHNLVEEYTALKLSYEQDIFPAISGLAKEFNRVRKSSYFAGLWGTTILYDLLWNAQTGGG